jgi:hypothetical protein
MPPKRTPIARPRRVAGVPPEAIDAARRLRGLDGPVPEGHDYQEARAVIRRAFGIAPWQIHPLDVDGADPPEWLAPRRDDVKRDRACELRRQLDEALTS